jgi:hypothetical protein
MMRPRKRLFFLGSRLFAIGIGVLVVISLCAGVALALGFTDVRPGDDYSEAIADLSDQGIINGFTDGTFRPGALVTRQQFAKMIVLTLGLPVSENDICPFSDVEKPGNNLYPDNYVAVCAHNGITVGKTANTFDPYNYITRAQVMTMVVRAAPLAGIELDQPTSAYYNDSKYVMRKFNEAPHGPNAQIAELNGLLWGIRLDSAGYWEPYKNATRGEVAQILWRLLQKIPTTDVLAYDNFEDPDSGWAENIYSNSAVGYVEGFYRILITADQIRTSSWWAQQAFGDAYYEAWAWPTPASGDWAYGLVFRFQDMDNLYQLSVYGDDTARLWKRVGGQFTALTTSADLPSSTNNGWRHLEVMMLGNTFMAYVDGVLIGEFTDNTFAAGFVGFYAVTYDQPEFAVFFDDFTVWPIVY